MITKHSPHRALKEEEMRNNDKQNDAYVEHMNKFYFVLNVAGGTNID